MFTLAQICNKFKNCAFKDVQSLINEHINAFDIGLMYALFQVAELTKNEGLKSVLHEHCTPLIDHVLSTVIIININGKDRETTLNHLYCRNSAYTDCLMHHIIGAFICKQFVSAGCDTQDKELYMLKNAYSTAEFYQAGVKIQNGKIYFTRPNKKAFKDLLHFVKYGIGRRTGTKQHLCAIQAEIMLFYGSGSHLQTLIETKIRNFDTRQLVDVLAAPTVQADAIRLLSQGWTPITYYERIPHGFGCKVEPVSFFTRPKQ